MKLCLNDIANLQRQLGLIEGIAMGIGIENESASTVLFGAVDTIDEILSKYQ